jgi:hypothetical protein
MRDVTDDTAHVGDGSVSDPGCGASRVSEPTIASCAVPEISSPEDALLQLLRLGPDTVIDQLCEGHPRNFKAECAVHVRDSAYFIEDGRVAARVIATLATLACGLPTDPGPPDLSEQLETIIEESTAAILEEGALPRNAVAGSETLAKRIGLVLGLNVDGAHAMIDALNSFEFEDRHVLYHCIIEGLSPDAYAARFQDDARVVVVMLRNVAAMAIDGKTE